MEIIALWISNINPWWLVTFSALLLILELFFSIQIFLTISIALIIPILFNFLNLNHFIQLWSFPISLLIAYLIQRKLFEMTSSEKIPYFEKLEDRIGSKGVIKVTEVNDKYSEEYFYAYKDKNDFDNLNLSQKNASSKIYKLQISNGRYYPVTGEINDTFEDGEEVEIIDVISGKFIVRKLI